MEFKYTENEDGTRTVYAFASHAPSGADLKSFELDTSKDGLVKALQELFDMIDWQPKTEPETAEPSIGKVIMSVLYPDMDPKQQLEFRRELDAAWGFLPVAYRSDLLCQFMDEVVRPMKVQNETNQTITGGANQSSSALPPETLTEETDKA